MYLTTFVLLTLNRLCTHAAPMKVSHCLVLAFIVEIVVLLIQPY
jgi:hypothetical protein